MDISSSVKNTDNGNLMRFRENHIITFGNDNYIGFYQSMGEDIVS